MKNTPLINNNFWQKAATPANKKLQQDMNVDIAIIGGGYTGLSTAWHLAKKNLGIKIAIFEAKSIGYGASGGHGGMIMPGSEAMDFDNAPKRSRENYDMTVASMAELHTNINNMDVEIVLSGHCGTILSKDDLDSYKHYVAMANKAGVPLELWDAERTFQELGTRRYAGALFDPNGGHVHAMQLINALRALVEEKGVLIYEHSMVNSIEDGKTIKLTISNNHQVNANAIVLATNGYTPNLGYFKSRIITAHTENIVTEPLTESQLVDIGWKSRLPYYDSRNFLYHLVLTEENRIVIGGGNAHYFYNDNIDYKGNLKRVSEQTLNELTTIYPALKGIEYEYAWSGVLGMTQGGKEMIGVTGKHKNIYYGLGYNGHGVNLSYLFGDVIASLYSEGHHPWFTTTQRYNKLPMWLPPEPLKYIGAQGMLFLLRMQDRKYIKKTKPGHPPF